MATKYVSAMPGHDDPVIIDIHNATLAPGSDRHDKVEDDFVLSDYTFSLASIEWVTIGPIPIVPKTVDISLVLPVEPEPDEHIDPTLQYNAYKAPREIYDFPISIPVLQTLVFQSTGGQWIARISFIPPPDAAISRGGGLPIFHVTLVYNLHM